MDLHLVTFKIELFLTEEVSLKSANKRILEVSVLKRVIGGTSGGGLDPTVKKDNPEKQEKAPLPPKEPEVNDLVRG